VRAVGVAEPVDVPFVHVDDAVALYSKEGVPFSSSPAALQAVLAANDAAVPVQLAPLKKVTD
jgi:hypothetical protein